MNAVFRNRSGHKHLLEQTLKDVAGTVNKFAEEMASSLDDAKFNEQRLADVEKQNQLLQSALNKAKDKSKRLRELLKEDEADIEL